MNTLILFIAQGLGSGRLPFGPGTWGSVVGLGWLALLLWPGRPWVFIAGMFLSIPASAWFCGRAEKILQKKDPGSVVFDEIIAIPMSFAAWVGWLYFKKGVWPDAGYFFTREHLLGALGVFALFRLFDIWKPWPVKQSQHLSGGWGVTVDDVLAAVYVNVVVGGVLFCAK